jgi:hypothetical protein
MDEIKKGIRNIYFIWKKGIDKGGEQYWHPKIIYWETIYKALDTPFQSIEHSTTNFMAIHSARNKKQCSYKVLT